ncbi:MAG: bile acid:sodium symporter family protein [Candidatus Latescibacteria bacterium]|jgi:bile acid:Na+ symporter, BASS family|nr:bile acid:sodium symporter family protein [Candidatus Latescibacterota bacterium]
MNNYYKVFLGICVLSVLTLVVMLFMGYRAETGPLAVAFFVALAIGIRGTPLKGLAFTVWIFAAVTASMFYPKYFVEIGSFQLKILIVPLMQIIMFGMGTAMSIKDFVGVIKMPKGVFVGMLCQFTIMPFVGFGLAKSFGFPPEIAAGVVLIGSSPCGLASNVMNYIASNNLALAVTLTACATMAAPIMTPFMMKMLAGQMIQISFVDMMLGIIYMVIIPIGAGLMFNHYAHTRFKMSETLKHVIIIAIFIVIWFAISLSGSTGEKLLRIGDLFKNMSITFIIAGFVGWVINYFAKGNTRFLDKIMPIVSMVGIAYIITIITAAGRDNLLAIGITLVFAAIIHNTLGYVFGYWGSRMFGLNKKDCRTIAIEVGLQNGGMASGLALQMGKVATVGLAPAVFGPWMNISGSALANWWRSRPATDDVDQEDAAQVEA